MTVLGRQIEPEAWTVLPQAPSAVIPPTVQRPQENPLGTAPVFSLGERGTQFWVWIQDMLNFLWCFFIHLFPFRLSLASLHWREVVVTLPLGFEAQLVPIVFNV